MVRSAFGGHDRPPMHAVREEGSEDADGPPRSRVPVLASARAPSRPMPTTGSSPRWTRCGSSRRRRRRRRNWSRGRSARRSGSGSRRTRGACFFASNIHGSPGWDRAQGFSFWVQGDGVDGFGGIEFIYDDDYAVRYDFAFPVKGSGWSKVTVAWSDLIPVLPGPRARPLGVPGGNEPSKLSGPWIGKWWYWGDYPAIGFSIDEIRLEPKIDRDPEAMPSTPPLARTLAKLKAGEPITAVTMGGLADRQAALGESRGRVGRPAAGSDQGKI